jgi:hypothetical protein
MLASDHGMVKGAPIASWHHDKISSSALASCKSLVSRPSVNQV